MNEESSALLCAIRGPVTLITVGTLFALDQFGVASFTRTWPAILIVLGIFSLGSFNRRQSQ